MMQSHLLKSDKFGIDRYYGTWSRNFIRRKDLVLHCTPIDLSGETHQSDRIRALEPVNTATYAAMLIFWPSRAESSF